jgi:hypothetical protein
MIAVFVTFRYGDDFNEEAVRKLAEGSRAKFEGMPGLRQKAFTVKPAKREATNVYLWNSDEAARALFTDEFLERVTNLYGVRPTVEFAQIAALVENYRELVLPD